MCDYGEHPDFWFELFINKARKEHECVECRSKIDIGESYCKCFSALDGKGETFKFCEYCFDLRKEYSDELGDCAIGSMWDVMEEIKEER